ncbi:Upstream activation factor subunit UAF30 [Morella rubra]|uniref:Upstream activation factor subunit UAF30 n=1 Tax=Morella rubra TaxID=262757 RepID=A0A6A1WR34_9ROSI|nr:Upstream activation factor subunit UAF30 [Morella rubra]KAB1226237.1 Upstream activation factor subunit UAF30 [Morella rubra]
MASLAASRWRAVFGGTRMLMAAAKTASSSNAKTKKAATTTPSRTGIRKQKMVPISPQLGNFLGGSTESSRTDAVKKIWEYIRLHNLQNPANKRQIFCDEKLKSIFAGKDTVAFQEITRLLSFHFVKSG